MIYELSKIVDEPRFEGFGIKDDTSSNVQRNLLREFLPGRLTSRDWEAPRLATGWKPVLVEGRVRKFNDFPCVNLSVPAFSQRAIHALHDLLTPNGELLPIVSELGSYFAFNVTRVADVLDWTNSDIRWNTKPILASRIERYEFFQEKVESLSIFRIPEIPSNVYVTDIFVSRVHETGLQGFDFIKVWPLPAGVIWWKLAKEERRNKQHDGLPAGRRAKGNAVVIRLIQVAKKPSALEKKSIARIMSDLDVILVDPDSAGPPIGSLEGHEYASGECRLFLSCSDADKLVDKLMPWFRKLDWLPSFIVTKRYGEYVDPVAREVTVEIE